MRLLLAVERLAGRVSGFFGLLAAWLGVAMIAVVFGDVVARYAFSGGSVAMQEMEWHLFAAMFLLGIAYTLREDAHVRVDVFYSRMSPRRRALVDLAGLALFVVPVAGVVLYASVDFVSYAWQIGESSPDPGGLPGRWAIKAVLPLAFLLLLVQVAGSAARNLRILLASRP